MIIKRNWKGCCVVSSIACAAVGSYGVLRAFGTKAGNPKGYVSAPDSLMHQRENGTCVGPVQDKLRFNCDRREANHICCFNRHYAEYSGYAFSHEVVWLEQLDKEGGTPMTYYDSITGKPLFKAPVGRSMKDFIKESMAHGWPSFRDDEVVWDNVRILPNGETVSTDGTHLGHNLPDGGGNRYCINLVSIAGNPTEDDKADKQDKRDINQ